MNYKEHYKMQFFKNVNLKEVEIKLEKASIKFQRKDYFPGYVIYKIEAIDVEKINKILDKTQIKKLEKMNRYFLDFRVRRAEKENPILEKSIEGKEYTVVGVIDNGISRIPQLKEWLYEDQYKYCYEKLNPTHGTFGAGVIIYGDELSSVNWVGGDRVKLYDAAIVPDFNEYQLEEDELLERIIKVVEEHSWIKVWNLAISIRFQSSPDLISDFSIVLDYLQKKYDILICKSSGNGDFNKPKEERGLLLQGADSVMSLVVSSCNDRKELSSFSLGGKENKILIKPDISMYGGDTYINEFGKRKVDGVLSFDKEGGIVSSFGTSFATARISRLVGNILMWRKNSSPLFIKSILAQTATNGERYFTGYGCPKNMLEIQKEYDDSIVIEKEILKEEEINFKYSNYKVCCTLACDVELDFSQEEDYVLSDIEVEFLKDDKILLNGRNLYKKFTNLKKYEFILKEESGEIKVRFYKRNKRNINSDYLKYCFIWKK